MCKTFGKVPRRGLEPPCLAAPKPESGVSTNSTIWANKARDESLPRRGLEPPHLTVPEPKSGVSTNSTTWAASEWQSLLLPSPLSQHWVARNDGLE